MNQQGVLPLIVSQTTAWKREEMAISPMVQRVEMLQADCKTSDRYDDQDAEAPGRSGGGLPGRAAHTPLQSAEEHLGGDQAPTGMPISPAPVREREHNVGTPQLAFPLAFG